MNKKKFNKVIDDAIDSLTWQTSHDTYYRCVCLAIYNSHLNGYLSHIDSRKIRYLFSELMREISECPRRPYFLGNVCKENVAYRTYMLEWFRYFVNEYKMYETLEYRMD